MKHIEKDLQLTSGSVLLRPYQDSDVDTMYEAVRESIAELSIWIPWFHPDYSIDESRTWIESQTEWWGKGTSYNFAVIDSRDNSFLGNCGLIIRGEANWIAGVGYWVRTNRTRQGVGTTATLLLAHFGFDELKLKRIEIITSVDNKASQRVAEKLGAIREGVLRNRVRVSGEICDAVLFSLIPRDFNRKQEYSIRLLNQQDHAWVVKILEQYWGSTIMVTRGVLHDAEQLPGFIALQNDKPVGLSVIFSEESPSRLYNSNRYSPFFGYKKTQGRYLGSCSVFGLALLNYVIFQKKAH